MNEILYQKIGVIVERLALDLLSKEIGERLLSISEYQNKFMVSRGTIQNALNHLKELRAVELRNRGHLGTYIEKIDYRILQNLCMKNGLLGIMPLPYSLSYAGLATAYYKALSGLNFNMAYIRGAQNRIKLVERGVYHFAICSYHAAINGIEQNIPVKIAMDFGEGSFLSKHVIVLKEKGKKGIEDGMRVAFDDNSLDQKEITLALTKNKKNISLVNIRAHQTIAAIISDQIDAGIWNYDEIIETGYTDLNIVPLDNRIEANSFSKAVMLIKSGEHELEQLLNKYIHANEVIEIQKRVKDGSMPSNY